MSRFRSPPLPIRRESSAGNEAMRLRVAWRLLCFEKTRGILAALGIFVATVLIFLQLGIYSSVPKAATLVYDAMPFDIALISSAYLYQASSQTIPRRRLY